MLKRLDKIERRLINRHVNLEPKEVFKLLYDTVRKYKLTNMISYFCNILCVSRSGYYRHISTSKAHDKRELLDLECRDIILKAFNKRGYKKGSRSIKMVLEHEHQVIFSRKRIRRIMNKYGIICPIRKANPYRRMMKATREHRVVPNKLNRNFKQGIPGKVLLTDITYIPYGNSNMAYLSTVKDGSTNEILAYHLSKRITLDIVTITIEKLVKRNKSLLRVDAFIHSDQARKFSFIKKNMIYNKTMDKITESLNEYFDEVETIKDYYGYFYSLSETIIITILGTFCGLKSIKQIQKWAMDERIREFLKQYCNITEIPCYSWFTQILGIIDPQSFNEHFIEWALHLIGGKTENNTISFDGKTVRSTGKMQNYTKPLHIVSGHLAELGITLGQKAVNDKTNEIPAVRELIELLDVKGCLIVADALNCQTKTAETIVKNGGDYLLSVKDNHRELKQEIFDYVNDKSLQVTMDKITKTEKNRERIEVRTAYVTNDIDWLYSKDKWPNLTCIGAINTQFETTKSKTNEWHYFISSRNLTAEDLLNHSRLEWTVETMHWLLDVHFNEDFCRIAEQRTQESLNIIRKIVLNLIRTYKNEKNVKAPFSGLMFECLLNPINIVKFL